ncbi:hypothetical protein BDN72DRAFT_684964 [Pluteus cervinus]|uniref:Uncharacterized protein n=1 Tax=Pluteus cervinus TaxID=181527 RepID=A0ACD3ARE9_9AGAR|nr:hypothetical protein BDN72DRAFT_684964 [Pluteus cervinus]
MKDIRKREYKRDQKQNKMLGFYPEVLERMNVVSDQGSMGMGMISAMLPPAFSPSQCDDGDAWGIPVPLLTGPDVEANSYMPMNLAPGNSHHGYPPAGSPRYGPYYGGVQPRKSWEQVKRSREQAHERKKAVVHARYRVEERGRIRKVEMRRVGHELGRIQEIARRNTLTKEQQDDQTDAVKRALALSSAAMREKERAVEREFEQKRIREVQRGQARAFPTIQVVHSVRAIEPVTRTTVAVAKPAKLLLDRPYGEGSVPGPSSSSRLADTDFQIASMARGEGVIQEAQQAPIQTTELQVTDVFGDMNQDECVYMKVRIRRKMRMDALTKRV